MGRAQTRCHLQFVWFFASVCKLSSYHFSLVPVERAMTATRERASSIRVPHHCRLGSDSNFTDSSSPNYFRCFMRPRGGSAGVQYRRTHFKMRMCCLVFHWLKLLICWLKSVIAKLLERPRHVFLFLVQLCTEKLK